jgi:hypothetical protein
MIPREKPEKIVCCRRGVVLTETNEFYSILLKSQAQRIRIPARMINGNNSDLVSLHGEENAVFKTRQNSLADRGSHFWKLLRILADSFKEPCKFSFKFKRQTGPLPVQKRDGMKIILLRRRLQPQSFHFRPRRFRASSRTCSHGIPLCGFFRNSSARRSSSAICSGVNSSLNPVNSCSMRSTTSRCCSGGNARISSMISATPISKVYHIHHGNQGLKANYSLLAIAVSMVCAVFVSGCHWPTSQHHAADTNFIPAEQDDMTSGWRNYLKGVVDDGGSRWWSVIYLTDEKKLTYLHFDLRY